MGDESTTAEKVITIILEIEYNLGDVRLRSAQ